MKLLEQVRQTLRVKPFASRTEQCYVRRVEQFVRFHKTADGWRHPATLGAPEVEEFLTHLAVERHVSASTQNQALAALLFLYKEVLRLELGSLDAVRARRTVQELLGLADVSTTTIYTIYTHALPHGVAGVRSPLDWAMPAPPPGGEGRREGRPGDSGAP